MLNQPSTTAIARTLLLAGLLLAVTVLAARSFFPAFAQEMIDYKENDSIPVATFAATDPEGETIDWTVSEDPSNSPDSRYFSVMGGVLRFKTDPDFECPKPNQDGACEPSVVETSNTYTVIVEASAGTNSDAAIKTATETVTVRVINVDEMGTIELSSLAPKEGVDLTATLTEPDGGLTNATDGSVEWKWERSEDGLTGWMFSATSTPSIDIDDDDDKAQTTFMPSADDAGYFLRVTASYDDGEGMDKEAAVVSDNKVVMTDYVNREPKFVDDMRNQEQIDIDSEATATTTRNVMENVAVGTAVGAPVRATDTDAVNNPEVLTYTLSGTDSGPFDIDSSTGQIKVGTALDFETPTDSGGDNVDNTYIVAVTATDPGRESSEIEVTIEITNIDEPPTIAPTTYDNNGNELDGRTMFDYEENAATGTTPISTYEASDPEDNNTQWEWSLTGHDADKFMTTDSGDDATLYFRSSPNFEVRSDRGGNNVYNVTVNLTDRAGNTDTRDVAVTVTNVDEEGMITLSHTTAEVGAPITATLSDLDGVVTRSVRWLWQLPGGATSSSATVRPADTGNASVTVSYTDGHGPTKGSDLGSNLINTVSADVQVAEEPQRRPVFKFNNAITTSGSWPEIREDTTDPSINLQSNGFSIEDGSDPLNYTLGGDTNTFQIADRTSPDITLQPGASFNYDQKSSYRVTVKATDPSGDNNTLTLTIPIMDLNEPPVFAAGGQEIDYPEIKNSRRNTDRVFDYNATDPERQSLTWSLANQDVPIADAFAFELSQSGVLTFKEPPDFDDEDSYEVTIQVTDGPDTGETDVIGLRPSTLMVTVKIENVDEPGKVTLSPTLQPKEDQEIEATLTDPDGPPDSADQDDDLTGIASTTWQWARSSSSNGPWTDIPATTTDPAIENVYTPRIADRGMYLRATASYSDGQGDDKRAQVVTDFAVLRVDYVNTPPKFDDDMTSATSTDTATTSREVAENAAAGTRVGAPVRAVDIGSNGLEEVLTYTLADANGAIGDAGKFDIDRRTGQINVKTSDSLNVEDPNDRDEDNMYEVMVTAKDPIGNAMGTASILVTIEVTDIKERPTMAAETATEGLSSTTTDEHTVDGTSTSTVLSLYRAKDHEDDLISTTTLTWTVSGTDAELFSIATTTNDDGVTNCDYRANPAQDNCAQLTFKNPIDFENPTDSNRDNKYNVTVNATDRDKMTVSRNVVVTVKNVDEPGTIALSHLQPEVGTPFEATLGDPDGGVGQITWQWATCSARADDTTCSGDPANISGAEGAMQSYTPATSTPGAIHLHVTATYSDAATPTGEEAPPVTAVSMNPVQPVVENNTPPSLPDGTITREVAEDASPTDPVGGPEGANPPPGLVLASDRDDDAQEEVLLYELEGPDRDLFTIDTVADSVPMPPKVIGRIRVGEGTELDYDHGRRTYTVIVRATDPAGLSDTVTVNINVTDVDETPELSRADISITGGTRIDYPENSTAPVQTYGVTGSDAGTPTWSLAGSDRSAFSISSAGVLTFNSPPDFEDARDTGGNNVYEVSVQAESGGVTSSRDVTVTVTDVEEVGSVAISAPNDEVKVGVELTAELSDGDEEVPSSVSWQWERGTSDTGPWTPIGQATNNTYTPVAADVGNYLRATVTYDDPHGTGKTLNSVTDDAVAPEATAGTDGAVTLSPTGGLVSGASVTAQLTDPDNPTNQVWQWQRSANGSTIWSTISGATSASYITTAADAGNYLRATVTYDDDSGTGLTLDASTSSAVKLHRFDGNASGVIERDEVIDAINDYLFGTGTERDEVIEVIKLYLFG